MLIPKFIKSSNRTEWTVRIYDEHGKRRSFATGLTSKRMVEEYERKLLTEVAEKKLFPERFLPKVKFKDFVPDYLQKHASKLRSYEDYTYTVKQLIIFFGNYLLSEIELYHVETFYAKRSKEVGVYAVNKEVKLLKGILHKAIDWHYLKENPVKGFKPGKEEPRKRFLRQYELEKLIEACGNAGVPYLRPLVIVAVHTGLRKEELLSLKWTNVDLGRKVLEVADGKGGFTRYVPIDETAEVQFALLHERQKGLYVFHDQYGRRILDIKKSFRAAVDRTGLADVRFHDLRRTFGTYCALIRVPHKTLQKWMGHKKIDTTFKYYVQSPEDFEHDEIKRLDVFGDTCRDTRKNERVEQVAQPLDIVGGDDEARTRDLLRDRQAL
jgi:integrase